MSAQRNKRVVRRRTRGDRLGRRDAAKPKQRVVELPSAEEMDDEERTDAEGMGGEEAQ